MTMDDLISRQDLIDRINGLMKSPWFLDGYVGLKDMAESKLNEFQIIDRLKWDERKNAVVIVRDFCVRGTPTVPAVPLDALCEWLGGKGMLPPCYFDDDACHDCEKGPYWKRRKSECWRECLTKWMWGLDGGESMVQKT
jgi:hypothetical protein